MFPRTDLRIFDLHKLESINIRCWKHILVCKKVVNLYIQEHKNISQRRYFDDIESWTHMATGYKDLFQLELGKLSIKKNKNLGIFWT